MKKRKTKIAFEYTDNIFTAIKWLNNLKKVAAFDFETASIYSSKEIEKFKQELKNTTDIIQQRLLEKKINISGLSYPSLTKITHLSFTDSLDKGYVIILKSTLLRKKVLNWLVYSDIKQIWHNANFDFKLIYYYTKKFVKNYEDTQQLAKCIMNHTQAYKANTKLKYLMQKDFGKWAISKDQFIIDNLYDEKVLEYAAIDAIATLKLWNDLRIYLKE